jgi:hypothetical protein
MKYSPRNIPLQAIKHNFTNSKTTKTIVHCLLSNQNGCELEMKIEKELENPKILEVKQNTYK